MTAERQVRPPRSPPGDGHQGNPRITSLLNSVGPGTAEELLPLVYDDLRRLARVRMAQERPGQTLQPTALVHEAFLRCGGPRVSWDSRRHYFAAAAEAMRRILIDQARRKRRIRHGGERRRQDQMDEPPLAIEQPTVDLLVVDEALQRLEAADPRAREIVNLRYFVGLTTAETAEVLGVSVSTIEREWRFLRTFLQAALGDDPKP